MLRLEGAQLPIPKCLPTLLSHAFLFEQPQVGIKPNRSLTSWYRSWVMPIAVRAASVLSPSPFDFAGLAGDISGVALRCFESARQYRTTCCFLTTKHRSQR